MHWPDTFRAAEALLDFDRSAEKRSWKRHAIKVTDFITRDPAALENLRQALSETFSRRKKRTRHCRIDVCDRFLDGGVQVSIYLEDDPNDPLEFDDTGAMHRRASGRRSTWPWSTTRTMASWRRSAAAATRPTGR